jgi:2-keto-4-pentenoate hydratase/2-oxohepta-3-ene-1,7-dioic acid hydratase in catechol pathway
MVAYTSTHEDLRPGDIFGSGTVSGGCGMEINRWLNPGDVVELEIEKIGVLRHRIGHPQPTPASWVPRV